MKPAILDNDLHVAANVTGRDSRILHGERGCGKELGDSEPQGFLISKQRVRRVLTQ